MDAETRALIGLITVALSSGGLGFLLATICMAARPAVGPEEKGPWGYDLMKRSVPHADPNHRYRCGLCKHLWLTLADDYDLRPTIKPLAPEQIAHVEGKDGWTRKERSA